MRNYSIRFLLDIRSESVNVPGSHKKTGAEAPVSSTELPLIKIGHSCGDVR
jgi:hypothetical protein